MFTSTYIPQTEGQEEQRVTKEPEETATKDCGEAHPTSLYLNLRKELEQCRKDIENFPILSKQPIFPLWDVPMGPGEIGFVNVPLTSTEVKNFKKEMKTLLEDPLDLEDQLD